MTHLATVTIDADQVAADLTDFVVTIDLSDLPTEFWSTVANGGGDIRCYKSDGTTELAREVVFCDQSTDTGVIHVKYSGTLSSSVDTEIQIHGDGTSSEPAVTATYGRNNVWTGYEFVLHLNQSGTDSADEFIDSTGNALHGTGENNSGNDTTANHPFGGVWQLLNGTNSRIDVGGSAGCVDGAGFTVQAMYRATSVGSDAGLITDDRNTTGDDLAITVADTGTEGGQYKVRAAGTFKVDRGSTRAVANTNYWAALVYDGTARTAKGYLQGVEDASSPNTGTSYTGVDDFWIGDYYNGNYDFPGYVGEAKVSTTKYSAAWLLTEYRNQSSTTTFYTATAAGGGGVSLTAETGSFTFNGSTAALSVSRKLSAEAGSFTFSGTSAGLSATRKLTAEAASFSFNGSDVTFTYSQGYAPLAAETGNFTFNGSDASLIVTRKLVAEAGSFTFNGSSVNLTYGQATDYTLTAETAAFAFAGGDAAFKISRKLSAESAGFVFTGADATLSANRQLAAGAGLFAFSGGDVTFSRTRALVADAGSFTFTGGAVTFTYSGFSVWTPIEPVSTTWTEI